MCVRMSSESSYAASEPIQPKNTFIIYIIFMFLIFIQMFNVFYFGQVFTK